MGRTARHPAGAVEVAGDASPAQGLAKPGQLIFPTPDARPCSLCPSGA
jgi:hypothetical protein